MTSSRIKKKIRRFCRKAKRAIKLKIYHFLVALYTRDYHISAFFTVCTALVLALFISLFLPKTVVTEDVTTSSVLGSELTHALRSTASRTGRSELNADVTLFLLPQIDDSTDLTELLSAPLYGFYLTGKELRRLPEYYASLSDSFPVGIPYTGGLSFTYNPRRIMYNRATEITLLTETGASEAIESDRLYYVIGNDLAFSMFYYLSERTFHMMNIRPKDSLGRPIADYSNQLLKGKNGSCTLFDIYRSYLLEQDALVSSSAAAAADLSGTASASRINRCTSINATALFGSLNIAGVFVLACFALLLVLAYLLRPYLYHMYIRFRVFRVHRRKRGKATLQLRMSMIRKKQTNFFKKLLTNRAA